jgi:uncharacterized protein
MIAGGSGPKVEAGTVNDRKRFYHKGLSLQRDFCQRGPTLSTNPPPKLSFPCDYPVKVMVRVEPNVRLQVDAIMERHAGPIDLSTVSERHSAQQHFMGITYVIHARSEQQIAELFAALKLCPQVLLVL